MYMTDTEAGVELVGEGVFAVPRHLAVRSLSHSSMRLWKECPEKWRRRRVRRLPRPDRWPNSRLNLLGEDRRLAVPRKA
jgi:hypothetical protein